jgi:CHAD domain-containing protein
MADGKWIRGLTPDMPPVAAARLVLEARLRVVTDFLPKAVHQPNRDPELVHQLRVGTRRADAALRLFRACLPGRVYRAARARLRTVRRAAGAARDWDVFLLGLEERAGEAKPKELPGVDCLIGLALGQRLEAQQALLAVEPVESFAAFVRELLDELRPPEEAGLERLADLAALTIPDRLQRLAQAAAGDLNDYEHLHQVRIAGKRLRYAMELLSECYPPPFREKLYAMVEEMQEILGRANDSHVAAGRLAAIRELLQGRKAVGPRLKPGVEALLRHHQRRLSQERKRFLGWWPAWVLAVEETGVR